MDSDVDLDAQARGTSLSVGPIADSADARDWRWRNYTDHLIDLGYELHGRTTDAAPNASELEQAVDDYQRRSRNRA